MHTTTPSYIVELPLRVNDQQNRFLEKAFEFGRTLYNATLGTALGRLQRMRETKAGRGARDMPKGKARTKAFSAVHKAFGLTEFGLTIIANNHRKASGRKDIGAHEAQSIGKAVWRGLQRHMFQKAGRPRFKSFRRGLNSIEGTNNREIMYKPERGAIVWRKHVMPYMKLDTGYMKEALASDRHVKYCRIVRRTLNGVKRWFVQLVVEGLPPVRKVYAPKCEVVGIDPGPSRIAYFHEQHAAIVEVAPHVDLQEPKIRLLQRRIDRSRRANNPDGTVKKGSSTWNTSNRGRRTAAKLAEHHRCLAATRKRDHGELVNDLLQIGGTIKIEKNNYRSFQRCFGRSTNRRGMGEFVEHLKRKAESAGCEVIELNAYKLKMSQYDPATDAYRKKPLKERWHRWGNTGTLVQRDAMSAFLACHATEKGHDRALLLEKWTTAEALLSGSGLCRHEPCSDPEVSKDASRLTKPNCGSKAEREYMVSSPFASVRGIFWVQLPLEGASRRVLHSIRGEATPLNLAFRGFVWVIPARNRIVKLSWNSAGR